MMLYHNRQFVGMREPFDFLDEGGFVIIEPDESVIPAVFAPPGATIYGESVTRMGVLGAYTMQKAIHQWFHATSAIEVTEGDWLEALPPTAMNVEHGFTTLVVFETSNEAYVGMLSVPSESKGSKEAAGEGGEEGEVPRVLYTMNLMKMTPEREVLADTVIAYRDRCVPYELNAQVLSLPITIISQLIAWMFDGDADIDLYRWAPSDSDQLGVTETLVPKCTKAQLRGYQNFLNVAQPARREFLN